MGVYGAKKMTVETAKEIWANHEKGKKPVVIAAMFNCCEATIKRIIKIGETARKQPEILEELWPGKYGNIKAAAMEKYAPYHKERKAEEDCYNSTTYLVAVLKQLNETNNYLNAICKALDIKN